ncbi:MAG: class I SAM-dependent methyltransferase [Herpetosiphon sp.]
MTQDGTQSWPAISFDDMYRNNPDPWNFETSPFEAEKYGLTLAMLPRARYRSAFEIGCSIGVLTEQLAQRCDALLAVDASGVALEKTRARCAHLPQVRCEVMFLPHQFPQETFDLILMSEVGYFLAQTDFDAAQEKTIDQLGVGGHLLLVHFTPQMDDLPLTGDLVHESFAREEGKRLRHLDGKRFDTYRMDLFERI